MGGTGTREQAGEARPMRADAQRNYARLLDAASAAFVEHGADDVSLEEIARRAGVGIGTLYRHFPTRQALLEAVYLEEVQAIARVAAELEALPPWEALSQWLERYVGFARTKKALNEALLQAAADSDVLLACRTAILDAGTRLVERAQEAGVVRSDTTFSDVARMVSGIAVVPVAEPGQRERLVRLALDGLR